MNVVSPTNSLFYFFLQALLCLHQPQNIELWNPESPINTFWDVRYHGHLNVLTVT